MASRFVVGAMVMSIALVAFLAYREMLGYFYIDTDTLTLIKTGRVQSSHDFFRIFTEPLMNGTYFTRDSKFYRPIATLSYGLDYAIWGLNPFGYHLANLLLHIVISILVFFVIRNLTLENNTAWLSALIFTIHPIVEECVPAGGRHDLLVMLFFLLALLSFFRSLSPGSLKRFWLGSSLLFYVIAFGAKEIAVILPVMIFSYILLFLPNTYSLSEKIVSALKSSLPYFVATFVWLAWRAYILQGVGGYSYKDKSSDLLAVLFMSIRIISDYCLDLLYPFGKSPFQAIPSMLEKLVALGLLGIFAALITICRYDLFGRTTAQGRMATRILKPFVSAAFIVSLGGIIAFPLFAPFVNEAITDAYSGGGFGVLHAAMKGKSVTPVEYYYYAARNALFTGLSLLFSVSTLGAIGLMGIQQRQRIAKFFCYAAIARPTLFLCVWMLLPLGIYIFLQGHAHGYMYIPAIPFSGIVAIILVKGVQSVARIVEQYRDSRLSYILLLREPQVIGLVATVLMVALLLRHSPIIRTDGEYAERKDIGVIWSLFFAQLAQIVPTLPQDTTLRIVNLPERISSYQMRVPHTKSVSVLNDHTVKSWLDLHFASNRIEVLQPCLAWYDTTPRTLELEVAIGKNQDTTIIVRPDVAMRACRELGETQMGMSY